MALQEYFPPRPTAAPTIYAFASTHPDHAGLLKVGYTERVSTGRGQCLGGRAMLDLQFMVWNSDDPQNGMTHV